VIVDSSALVAILRAEPEATQFSTVIASAPRAAISAASYLETAIVIDGYKTPQLSNELDAFLTANNFVIEPVTVAQAKIARQAYRDYGKGSGHPAQLNFGDCFAYALAKEKGEPLLFKGTDFGRTDVRSARN
jgi:ribonuclease VapC